VATALLGFRAMDAENTAQILRSVRCSLRLLHTVCTHLREGLPALAGDRPTETQRQAILALDAALAQAAKTAGSANLALGSIPIEPRIQHYLLLDEDSEFDRLISRPKPQRRSRRHTGKFLILYKSRLRK